jgi:SAM-dependent methyltransferase
MLHALQMHEVLTVPERSYSEADIFAAVGVSPRNQQVVARWLRLLAERGYVKRRGAFFERMELIGKEQVEQRWAAAMEAWAGKLGSRTIIEYLIANAERLSQLMSGEQQAALLLFPEGRMDIASALYRDSAIARYLNRTVADEVMRIAGLKLAATGAPGSPAASLRIVELGAGTGAASDAVIDSLKTLDTNRLRKDYLYTDISPFFISAARERYKDCSWVQYRLIDVDQNLAAQGIEPESADMVIAAGMLNNVRDTDRAIREIMQCLAPGGTILITEPVREFVEMLISQAFMMTSPEDDRKNTDSTFMNVDQWLDVFRRAGAEVAAVLPGETHPLAPLGQKLFVARKGT